MSEMAEKEAGPISFESIKDEVHYCKVLRSKTNLWLTVTTAPMDKSRLVAWTTWHRAKLLFICPCEFMRSSIKHNFAETRDASLHLTNHTSKAFYQIKVKRYLRDGKSNSKYGKLIGDEKGKIQVVVNTTENSCKWLSNHQIIKPKRA